MFMWFKFHMMMRFRVNKKFKILFFFFEKQNSSRPAQFQCKIIKQKRQKNSLTSSHFKKTIEEKTFPNFLSYLHFACLLNLFYMLGIKSLKNQNFLLKKKFWSIGSEKNRKKISSPTEIRTCHFYDIFVLKKFFQKKIY